MYAKTKSFIKQKDTYRARDREDDVWKQGFGAQFAHWQNYFKWHTLSQPLHKSFIYLFYYLIDITFLYDISGDW